MFFHRKIQSYNGAHKQNTKPESNRQEEHYKTRKQQAGGTLQNQKATGRRNTTKPESNRQEEHYNDFHLYDKFLLFAAYSRPGPIEKKALAKRSKFSLIRKGKIVTLSFMTLGMDLVLMSDKRKCYDVG